jgi:hypothetical protein
MAITEIRLLPPLALARLGSSPEPLENYELETPDAVGPRAIVAATSLRLDAEGKLTAVEAKGPVQFRDENHLIKPVAPFFELFARVDDGEAWVPVTEELLAESGLGLASVKWSAHLANTKIQRRTGHPEDRIEAEVEPFNDHVVHPLHGRCDNFIEGASVPLGHVQLARPNEAYPGLRLRYTPAHGKVYGSKTDKPDPNVVGVVYDGAKPWHGYTEVITATNDAAGRGLTIPGAIFAGYDDESGDHHISYGYVDDECDGTIEVRIDGADRELSSFARVAAGPPTFAPDSKPIRSVADELEQALEGPTFVADSSEIEAAREIVRCALETVRLMNTGQMNKGGIVRGVGMARMDTGDVGRKPEPIFDPSVAESLAIRARHERVLLALESGSLVWFAGVLRAHDQVGDLTDEGRRRMPGMMRNADGRHLALTRRQVSKIKAAASAILQRGAPSAAPPAPASESPPKPAVVPLNLSAQLAHRAQGNPPNSLPDTAISNAYPGLEMDFRNVWKRILQGVVLHEATNLVVAVDDEALSDIEGKLLMEIAGVAVTAPVIGPDAQGVVGPLKDTTFGDDHMVLEWSNALADVVHAHQGKQVRCVFQSIDGKQRLYRELTVRHFFEPSTALLSKEIVRPGDLTQSLCAPWQNDYRECSCFYWAANRPDYVNVEPRADGSSTGNNWMQKDRTASTPRVYVNDDWQDARLLSHTDLVSGWEQALRFIIANKDEPAGKP